jgi:hypothetical protein
MADKVFTLFCSCEGDSCSCHNPLDTSVRFDFSHLSIKQCNAIADELESLPHEARISILKELKAKKDLPKMTTTNILEAVRAAKDLSVTDLKTIIQALSAEVRAKESANSKHSARLERLAAANDAASRGDGKLLNWTLKAQRGLRDLGLSDNLDAHAKDGYSITQIDAAMKAKAWDQEKRIAFKSMIDQLGLLAS